jgi:hypothetical protein
VQIANAVKEERIINKQAWRISINMLLRAYPMAMASSVAYSSFFGGEGESFISFYSLGTMYIMCFIFGII